MRSRSARARSASSHGVSNCSTSIVVYLLLRTHPDGEEEKRVGRLEGQFSLTFALSSKNGTSCPPAVRNRSTFVVAESTKPLSGKFTHAVDPYSSRILLSWLRIEWGNRKPSEAALHIEEQYHSSFLYSVRATTDEYHVFMEFHIGGGFCVEHLLREFLKTNGNRRGRWGRATATL